MAIPESESVRLESAFQTVFELLLEKREASGHWVGQLSASALSTATAISAMSFYLDSQSPDAATTNEIKSQIQAGLNWIATQQNDDGGWGDTDKSYSNISTTMLVIAAFHAVNQEKKFAAEISLAQKYTDSLGGIPGLRQRYGRDKTFAVPILANCAMAGIVPWKEVSALPFEAACVPQRFYHLMQLPVVSYAIPALVAIGQAKFANDPPWNPITRLIRKLSIKRSLAVLKRMQPASGGFLEAVPLTSFVSMGLIKSGHASHSVVDNGIRFVMESFRNEESNDGQPMGSWPIDTNLATWNTTLAMNAIANLNGQLKKSFAADPQKWQQSLDWLLSCQNQKVHPFTGSPPGGWGWTDLSGAVPDADDTPGALLALKNMEREGPLTVSMKQSIRKSAASGVAWLLKLQNRDYGWPTFCRGWGRLPFDRSGADITAHALRALFAWREDFESLNLKQSTQTFERAIKRGFDYLRDAQQNDGSWQPLWFGNQDLLNEINPCYGTSKVLMAYRDANLLDTKEAQSGLRWLVNHQNDDGGWGGGASISWSEKHLGTSSIEESALCLEILLADKSNSESMAAAQKGLGWILSVVEAGEIECNSPIGFYFAKLWYHERLYPLIFATGALATCMESQLE